MDETESDPHLTQITHKPTPKTRNFVEMYVLANLSNEEIADILGIETQMLERCYAQELKHAVKKANALITNTLYQKAVGGDVKACQFWLKAKAGWCESDEFKKRGPQDVTVAYGLGLRDPIEPGQLKLPYL